MVIFHSDVKLPEGKHHVFDHKTSLFQFGEESLDPYCIAAVAFAASPPSTKRCGLC